MTGTLSADFEARLHRVAVDLAFSVAGPHIEKAVVLAEDLVAAGLTGNATVEVAALPRNAIRSDAEPLMRDMLAEHGVESPVAEDEAAEYLVLLRAFGFWELPITDFHWPFLHQLPSWDEQDPLERTLIELLDELDHVAAQAAKAEVVERMRAAVRDALA